MEELSLEQKVRLLTGAGFLALHAVPAIGLRAITIRAGRGGLQDERAVLANVPSPIALAATWDLARVERIGRLLGGEARRNGVDVLLEPTADLQRSPLSRRTFERFSEDPYLTGAIGAAFVRGLQGEGVAAGVKHFVAHDAGTERFTVDVHVSERALRELYLLPFELIVRDAGPWAVMTAYNPVNGESLTGSALLRSVLVDEWGFDGVIMSNWYAARDTVATATSALSLVLPGPGPWHPALAEAIRAGTVPESVVDEKLARLRRLAERVGALAAPGEAAPPGASGPPAEAAPAAAAAPAVDAELRAAAAASFVLARNHGALLPLTASSLRKVAVVGPNAAAVRMLDGNASASPQPTVSPLDGLRAALKADVTYAPGVRTSTRLPVADISQADVRFLAADGSVLGSERQDTAEFKWTTVPDRAVAAIEVHATLTAATAGEHLIGCSGLGHYTLTLDGQAHELEPAPPDNADPDLALFAPPQAGVPLALAAGQTVDVVLRRYGGDPLVRFALNHREPLPDEDAELERAVRLAREADVAIVVVGTTPDVESESFDRTTLALPGRQDELVRRVNAAQPRTIAVVNAGAPVLLPWLHEVPATLLTWFGGEPMSAALADVLLGDVEPGGRLPSTWPARDEDVPSVTPADGILRYDEELAIGYRGPIEPALPFGHGLGYTLWTYLAMDGPKVRLVNTGTRRGREVVQVYASRPDSAIERPRRWLAGFVTVDADPDEEVIVDVPLSPRAFQHWDGGWQTEPGAFILEAGSSSADLPLRSEYTP